ncbi:30S ribosomal protein S6 [Oscillospiraceae bacterium PP1C4]
MAKLTANYETVMVFSVKNGEESVTALVEKFNKLISENSTINKVDTWGQRALAYPINDETAGYYVVVDFTSTPEFPAELDRVYKITDGVLRTLIVAKEA